MKNIVSTKKIKNWHWPLIILIAINITIGFMIVQGFGESVDELSQNLYAQRTIQAIQNLFKENPNANKFFTEKPAQGSHGPAFIVSVNLLKRFFLQNGSRIDKLTFTHFIYFIFFLVGVISFYFLALRWLSRPAALGATLLFNTQPLLVGHAFMNPKDVVFMSLLTTSAVLGLWMLDRQEIAVPKTGTSFLNSCRLFLSEFGNWDVWLAGLVLGFSSAIRIAAPIIGLIVLAYVLLSRRWQVLPRFFTYAFIAFGFMLVFWPYLWPDPVGRLMGSLFNSAYYPGEYLTLFKGGLFNSDNIPLSYLPVLMLIQLTETTLLLIMISGLALFKKIRWDFLALFLIWFGLPFVMIIISRMKLYNNFRQVFFILPPLFLLAGFGLDWLFVYLKKPAFRYLIIFLVLLPGLYANITLYPYQYVYYNQLVGGLPGAYRKYELDYWNLAFREAQEYINQTASQGSNIYVIQSKYLAQTFARPDLIYNAFGGQQKDKYDYIIVSTAGNEDKKYTRFRTVYTVERFGVPLAYVKKP